jgi:hypothetical protein
MRGTPSSAKKRGQYNQEKAGGLARERRLKVVFMKKQLSGTMNSVNEE